MALPQGAVGWSVVCDCVISWVTGVRKDKLFASLLLYASFPSTRYATGPYSKKNDFRPMRPLRKGKFWPQGHNLNTFVRNLLG